MLVTVVSASVGPCPIFILREGLKELRKAMLATIQIVQEKMAKKLHDISMIG